MTAPISTPPPASGLASATLAGGCFWCLEALFQRLDGVLQVMNGYCGGHLENPDYASVCQGDSGHVEAVKLQFDPAIISYRQLLMIFFASHDPTTRDQQGNDIGTQYRSVIFTHSPEQARCAEALIDELAAGLERPIVTEVRPASHFWPAEAGHHDYYNQHPQQAYCQWVIAPKLAKFVQHKNAWLAMAKTPG